MTNKKLSVLACPAAVLLVLLAACASRHGSGMGAGGTTSPAAGGGAPAAPGSTQVPGMPGLARCRTADLKMALDTGQSSGAAGSMYLPLNFTNTSSAGCGMFGFPGVSFVTSPDSAGQQVGAAAQRNSSFGSIAVKLDPGAMAHAWLQVADAANYPLAVCHPKPAEWLRVYPPNEATAGYASGQFSACSLPAARVLTVLPARSGRGKRGAVP